METVIKLSHGGAKQKITLLRMRALIYQVEESCQCLIRSGEGTSLWN